MRTIIDQSSWNRAEHFAFFDSLDCPYCSIVVHADCSPIYEFAKTNGYPFSVCLQFAVMHAANRVEHFRYRIENDRIVCYQTIGIGGVEIRPDETIGFNRLPFTTDFGVFIQEANRERERILSTPGIAMPKQRTPDTIHYSNVPWYEFSQISHPTNYKKQVGTPRVTTGKMSDRNGRKTIPFSIVFHHGLMDGIHISHFIDQFERFVFE